MNLESKLLDGKPAGYCSSSEGEDEPWQVANDEDQHQANVQRQFGSSGNTGPKGVLNDFKEFREVRKAEREARDRAILRQARKGLLQSSKEERERAAAEENNSDDEEDSLESLRRKRQAELRKAATGRMVEILDKDQFLGATDGAEGLLGVVIYGPNLEECERLSHVCKVLAADHPRVKFIRARSTILGMSKAFTETALPTLQFYNNGQLVGNFVQLSNLIGQDYDATKLRKFLRKNRINLVRSCVASDSEYSTDEDLD